MHSFADERWVRVMCDYCADGVWHQDGAAGCADDLPVGKELVARLRAWQQLYETNLELGKKFDWKAFSAEGLSIARAVKAALPEWTVIFFDDAELAGRAMDTLRAVFEYEVHIDCDRGHPAWGKQDRAKQVARRAD